MAASWNLVLFVCILATLDLWQAEGRTTITKRSAGHKIDHSSMMHNHLSRRIFDRACAASKDIIEEVIACLTGNESLIKTIKPEVALKCYKDSFGVDFDPNDMMKHKELICNNRSKFEQMTTCVYQTTSEAMDSKQVEKLVEAMVDVGLCITNVLDG